MRSLAKDKVLLVGGGVLLFSAGSFSGYISAKRVLEPKYAEIAEREIAEAKEFYKRANMIEEYADPETAAVHLGLEVEDQAMNDAVQALREYSPSDELAGEELIDELEDPESTRPEVTLVNEEKTENIFAAPEPELPDPELPERVEGRPYIISRDEFNSNDEEYEQTAVVYFEGDGTLADHRDLPIPDIDEVVGNENVDQFGVGSLDPNVVYVRNDRLEMDFEITRSKGKFAEEVFGFIEHSERPRLRKFRDRDE